MTVLIHSGERLDELHPYGMFILQHPDAFRFGTDAVLLAHFARAKRQHRVLDLGTGTGILPLLIHALFQPKHITGIEIQPNMADMAQRSVAYNQLTPAIEIITGDYTRPQILRPLGQYDVVVCNPPYGKLGHGECSVDAPHALARFEICADFAEICRSAQMALTSMGHFFCIHQTNRLMELLSTLHQAHLEPKRLRFVHSNAEKNAGLVLIECIKGGKSGMKVEPPLFLTDAQGKTSLTMEKIYQGGLL